MPIATLTNNPYTIFFDIQISLILHQTDLRIPCRLSLFPGISGGISIVKAIENTSPQRTPRVTQNRR